VIIAIDDELLQTESTILGEMCALFVAGAFVRCSALPEPVRSSSSLEPRKHVIGVSNDMRVTLYCSEADWPHASALFNVFTNYVMPMLAYLAVLPETLNDLSKARDLIGEWMLSVHGTNNNLFENVNRATRRGRLFEYKPGW